MARFNRGTTMKIGVISDTHLKEPSAGLMELAKSIFKDVDMILHAGDLVSLRILKAFHDKKVVAVRGNMDLPDSEGVLQGQEIIEVEGFRIGLIHGWGSPIDLEEKIRKKLNNVHVIVYGHSHVPANHFVDGVLFFNPGSFGSGRSGSGWSVGILHVQADGVRGEIIEL